MTLRVNPATAAMLACLALCAVPASSHAADTITLDPRVIPVGKWAEGIAVSDNSLWVAESGQRTIAQIDLNRGNVVRRVQVGRLPVGMMLGNDGAVYTLVQTDNLVWQQPKTNRGRALGGLAGCPQGLAGADQYLWVLTMPECSSVSSRLVRIDPRSGERTSSKVLAEWGQAVTTHQGKVWVAQRAIIAAIPPQVPRHGFS
jgi:DNA-binding beta-propeller fold protein YncE